MRRRAVGDSNHPRRYAGCDAFLRGMMFGILTFLVVCAAIHQMHAERMGSHAGRSGKKAS